MSKNKNIPSKGNQKIQQIIQPNYSLFPFPNHILAYIVLGLVSVVIYFNSIWNENALDDGIIIQKNEFVLKGNKGLRDIMTRDSYYSFYRQMNAQDQLKGGRYRPLSVITFALEQEFVGTYNNGTFQKAVDKNQNGTLEPEEVNAWQDKNNDKVIQNEECAECWDKNQNFQRDALKKKDVRSGKDTLDYLEDINKDGNVNDKDCEVEGAMMRHTNNVLFYMLSILVLFGLLKNYLFRNNHDLAFLAALLFAIHPIHTEVVANVKSRDEILSLLFICLTFVFAFKYLYNEKPDKVLTVVTSVFCIWLAYEYKPVVCFLTIVAGTIACLSAFGTIKSGKVSQLMMTGLMFWLALLAKEYAFTLLLVLPMTVWLVMKEAKLNDYLKILGVIIFWFFVYLVMRISSVTLKPGVPDTEILNNPYLPITTNNPELGWKKDIPSLYATKIFVLLKYLQLQFFPHPLSSDYSYNTIPFKHFNNPEVWLSLLLNIGLFCWGLVLFVRRNLASLAFMFYFANLLMIGNIIFDIGATMGERLVYHSSLGVCIGVAWLLTEGLTKIMKVEIPRKVLVIAATLIICATGAYKTYQRNYDWKNDITLFCHDVETVPNSVLVLGNAGARWIDKAEWPENKDSSQQYIKKAKGYLLHALELHPNYVNGYLNLGLAYYKLNDLDSATITWKNAENRYPTNPYIQIYYNVLVPRLMAEAYQAGQKKDYKSAVHFMDLAVTAQPNNPETAYNMGGAYFSMGMKDSAAVYFRKCLKLKPDHKQAQDGLNASLAPTNTITLPQKKVLP